MKEIKRFKLHMDEFEFLTATVAPAPYFYTRMYEYKGKYFIIIKDEGPDFRDPPLYTLYEVTVPTETDINEFLISEDTPLEQLPVDNRLLFSIGKPWDDAVRKVQTALIKIYP